MPSPTIADLVRLAASYDAGHRVLLDHARRLAALHGVEVLDVRSTGEDGTLEVRVRLSAWKTDPPAQPLGDTADHRTIALPPEPPFVSPVRASAPFEGDGTTDVPRFIREADPVVIIPPRHAPAGIFPVALGPEERVRMLAGTIAGDVLLSLEHQGRHLDAAAVDGALLVGRDQYAGEVERAGFRTIGEELLAHYDTAARAVRHQLGAA
jgi:hypothetical protein